MGRNIAIVEDEPLIRANYVEALNRFGYDTRGYGSRREASNAFAIRLPELVIIDIGLGDEPEGGFDLRQERPVFRDRPAAHRDLNRRRRTKTHHFTDNIGRLKREPHVRQ